MINLKNTSDITGTGVKILAYGQSGAGKTRLIPSLPAPVAISAEGGLLSIKDSAVPFVEIATLDDLKNVHEWIVGSDEAEQFQSVAIDSISEIAEVVLAHEKATSKDPRQAYGEMASKVTAIVRSFREVKKNVYMTAKMDRVQDEQGRLLHGPSAPGKTISAQLPYFFDEVFAIRLERDADGQQVRMIQTAADDTWSAKDRSGKLDQWTPYNTGLGGIIAKIEGE